MEGDRDTLCGSLDAIGMVIIPFAGTRNCRLKCARSTGGIENCIYEMRVHPHCFVAAVILY